VADVAPDHVSTDREAAPQTVLGRGDVELAVEGGRDAPGIRAADLFPVPRETGAEPSEHVARDLPDDRIALQLADPVLAMDDEEACIPW